MRQKFQRYDIIYHHIMDVVTKSPRPIEDGSLVSTHIPKDLPTDVGVLRNMNPITQDVVKQYYDACHSLTKQKFLDRRYGSLSKDTKQEIYKLDMSMCLEQQYMKCMKHAKESVTQEPKVVVVVDPTRIMEICEPLVEQYMILGK